MIKSLPTFEGRIYIGLKEGYDGPVHTIDEVKKICQDFADKEKICVTVTTTEFIYTKGNETGAVIGGIIYPRFPEEIDSFKNRMIYLLGYLQAAFKQIRVSVVFTDETLTFGE